MAVKRDAVRDESDFLTQKKKNPAPRAISRHLPPYESIARRGESVYTPSVNRGGVIFMENRL